MNDIDNVKLREQFNPDGSLLRKHQLRMLEMLKYIDAICEKYNLKYWLSSGTLLGAVRHQGFIPWDDDLDIEMLKKDYQTLVEIMKRDNNENYVLQTHETDPNYFVPYAKLRDRHSYLKETNSNDLYYKYNGIYIDVFNLEPSSSCFLSKISTWLQYRFLYNANKLQGGIVRKIYFKCIYFVLHKIVFPCLSLLSKIAAKGQLRHVHGSCFLSPRNMKDIFPLGRLNFEGFSFPVPYDYNKYLSELYGNYMKLPELDTIEKHLTKIYFYDD